MNKAMNQPSVERTPNLLSEIHGIVGVLSDLETTTQEIKNVLAIPPSPETQPGLSTVKQINSDRITERCYGLENIRTRLQSLYQDANSIMEAVKEI